MRESERVWRKDTWVHYSTYKCHAGVREFASKEAPKNKIVKSNNIHRNCLKFGVNEGKKVATNMGIEKSQSEEKESAAGKYFSWKCIIELINELISASEQKKNTRNRRESKMNNTRTTTRHTQLIKNYFCHLNCEIGMSVCCVLQINTDFFYSLLSYVFFSSYLRGAFEVNIFCRVHTAQYTLSLEWNACRIDLFQTIK